MTLSSQWLSVKLLDSRPSPYQVRRSRHELLSLIPDSIFYVNKNLAVRAFKLVNDFLFLYILTEIIDILAAI